jgi:uncharacterized membrane protein
VTRNLVIGFAALAVVFSVVIWAVYGGVAFLPGLAAGFAATYAAFLVSLAWDRRQRLADAAADADKRRANLEEETDKERQTRRTEATRRLRVIAAELNVNRAELNKLGSSVGDTEPLVVLRSGAWRASAGPLGEILSDIELVAVLSDFYDRQSELQWRLRWIVELFGVASRVSHQRQVTNVTDQLVRALKKELDPLVERINAAIADPAVDDSDLRRIEIAATSLTGSFAVGRPAIYATSNVGDGPPLMWTGDL